MSHTIAVRNTLSRKLGTLLLAGGLVATGVVAAQLGAAPAAQAAVCGSTAQWNGYAHANNPCGTAYAEVDRYIGGKKHFVAAQVYKRATTVKWTAGTRAYEVTARW